MTVRVLETKKKFSGWCVIIVIPDGTRFQHFGGEGFPRNPYKLSVTITRRQRVDAFYFAEMRHEVRKAELDGITYV